MKLTASILTIFAASIFVLQSCGTDSSTEKTELSTILDEAADREGIPSGECRDACVVAALAVFDACTEDGGDREACFGRAIHSFFECVRECPPPTCEERCEAKAAQHRMECRDEGGTEDGCNREARALLEECQEEACSGPTPPNCKDRCDAHAEEVYDRCIGGGTGGRGGSGGVGGIGPTPKRHHDGYGGDDGSGGVGGEGGEEKRCAAIAREALESCIAENCEDPEPPPSCEGRCENAATEMRDECVEEGGDVDECNMAAREWLAECNAKHCEDPEPPNCEDKCGALAEHVYEACTHELDSEERCAKITRAIQKLCNKHCAGHDCPCHGDEHCDDEDSDTDSDSGQ